MKWDTEAWYHTLSVRLGHVGYVTLAEIRKAERDELARQREIAWSTDPRNVPDENSPANKDVRDHE